jgi:hypothetical protein
MWGDADSYSWARCIVTFIEGRTSRELHFVTSKSVSNIMVAGPST